MFRIRPSANCTDARGVSLFGPDETTTADPTPKQAPTIAQTLQENRRRAAFFVPSILQRHESAGRELTQAALTLRFRPTKNSVFHPVAIAGRPLRLAGDRAL